MAASASSLPRALADVVSRGELVVPPYPGAALRLQRVVNSPNFGLSEVADAASADPVLAAALLRVANSPLYQGGGSVITNLSRAVHRLGARSVASIAVAAGLNGGAIAPGPLVDVKYRVWRRSVTTALAAQKLASLRGLDAEEALLAGLLHGFGRCVAVACLEKLLPSFPQQSMSLIEWMRAVEPHRAALARAVVQQWQLPGQLAAAITTESAPPGSSPTAVVVVTADHISEALESGASGEQIALVTGIQPGERRGIDEFLIGLPSAIEALLEPGEPPKRQRVPTVNGANAGQAARPPSQSLSAVSKPDTALPGELRNVSLPVVDLRSRREPVGLVATACVQEGLVLESLKPMQESCVVRLGLGSGPNALEGWFSVVLCIPARGRFRVEVQPFAPSRELRKFLSDTWVAGRPS